MKTRLSFTMTIVSAATLAGCGTAPVATVTVPATVAVVPAPAQTAVLGATAVPFTAADTQFIAVAAGAGMYEVAAARVALERASSPQVRSYAQMLLDQHTASNRQLAALVNGKGHRVVPGLPAVLQQKVDTLSRLSGDAFDREFVRMTGVQDHLATIAAFDQARATVTDRDLRNYIETTLPALRSHLQQAQDLAGRMAG